MLLEAADGLQLSYSDWRREGHPVLFLHGFSNDRHVWHDTARGLPEAYRPLTLDLRGHGDSDWSLDARYDVRDYAMDLPYVFDALGIDRAVVVGHSLGGNAATLFAGANPERVEALVLVDTGPSLSAAAWQRAAGDAAQIASSFDRVEDYARLLAYSYPMGAPEMLQRMATSGLVRRLDGRLEPKLDPILLELTGTEEQWAGVESALWTVLGKLECPALVLRGERSAMLGEEVAREMAEKVLSQGRWATVPAAGHAVAVDNAPGLLAELSTFLDTLH